MVAMEMMAGMEMKEVTAKTPFSFSEEAGVIFVHI